ncbi:MAG: hypothetical protein JWN13_2183 [Betaproteobacteria bacterium]|nr:hypothetical protein [Betaproteobacteria bacterium]
MQPLPDLPTIDEAGVKGYKLAFDAVKPFMPVGLLREGALALVTHGLQRKSAKTLIEFRSASRTASLVRYRESAASITSQAASSRRRRRRVR